MKRFLWLGFVLFAYLIGTGCGDTFRPIIIPNPPTFPNPAAAHTVLSINYNAECTNPACTAFVPLPGTAMVVDVSGDTDVGITNLGLAPVQAAQQSANQVLVVNQALTGTQQDSLTQLGFSGNTIAVASTISLPPNSSPNFVAVAPSSPTAYVTLPTLNSVAVVSTVTNNQTYTIATGTNPYALAVTPDNTKLYVANLNDSTISGFNTLDRSQRVGSPTQTSSPPIYLLARSDSQQIYVLEQNGDLGTLNTTSTAGPDPFNENTGISVPGADILTYDPNLNRLYIAGGTQLAIVDVSQSPPQQLALFQTCQAAPSSSCIPIVPVSSRGSSDPCAQTTPATLTVVAAAALPNGSQSYVAAYYEDASNNICPQVTAINAASLTIQSTTPIPGFPDATISPTSAAYAPICATTRFRFMMAAGGDSSRAYLSSCDGGAVNIIDTATDSYIGNLQAPISSHSGSSSPLNPPQNPVFLLAGP